MTKYFQYFHLFVFFSGMRPTIPHVQPILSPIVSTAAYSEVTIPIGVQEAFVRSGSTASFQCNGKGKKYYDLVLIPICFLLFPKKAY